MTASLFSPYRAGQFELPNRLVMAPMTRNRADVNGVPTPSMVTYYAQRASAGLIVTEGTQPSATGQGYPFTPGMHTEEQAAAWRQVTDAVHEQGGRILLQIMHAGRISHPSLQPNGDRPVAPSAVRPAGQVFTAQGLQDFLEPRPLETEEIARILQDYADAARLAADYGGFDGVEVHGANGYLPHQFLAEGTNHRTDQYGSAENRARFLVEVTAAVAAAVGGDRVGVRLSPANSFNDIVEHETEAVYAAVVEGLSPLGLAYLHVVEGPAAVTAQIRQAWSGGTLIVNPAFSLPTTTENLQALLSNGPADLVAVGRAFIANPDLVRRLRLNAPMNPADETSFYGGTDAGYIDYPALDQAA